MGMIHGRTATGTIVPILVAADGSLGISTITPGTITIEDASIEAMIGGVPEQFNGTATDVAATITPAAKTRSLLIDNTGVTNNLLFSLAGGVYKTLPPEASISLFVDVTSFLVKCAAGLTTTYEIIAVEAE